MRRNVGTLERKIRIAAGIALLAAALLIEWPDAWEALGGIAGAALVLTGYLRYCPVNRLLGRRAA